MRGLPLSALSTTAYSAARPMTELSFLRSLPLFRSLDDEELARLCEAAQLREYATGEPIVAAGDRGDSMYLLLSGQVEVTAQGNGAPVTATLGPGDFFGEMALLTGTPRGADVVARGDVACRCLEFSRPVVEDLLRKKPRVARFLTELVGRRLLESGQVRQVGKYSIKGEIGRGGAARVFEGVHPALRRSVAIKMLSHELVYESDFAERFLAEARIVADLRHENIVQVYDQEAAYATFFIIMERLSGEELSMALRRGPFSVDETKKIARQVCRGLQYAHKRGVVHRDIKPSNIFLEEQGPVKVMDFGIAVGAHGPLREDNGVMGTPGFIAPESLLGKPVDHRADIYSLGVVLYMMLTGWNPFAGPDMREVLKRQLTTEFLDVAKALPTAPPALVDLVKRATARDPAARFPDCGAMLRLLDERTPAPAAPGCARMELELDFPEEATDRVGALVKRWESELRAEVERAVLLVRR
ncbi:MAG: protein kinase domain-containing protein [Myxococcota bacterium]